MTSKSIPSAIAPRGFFVTPSYVRVWFAGEVGNSMRWLELLVAGIFTYDATHSTFLVAVVTVARSLPMLFVGAIARGDRRGVEPKEGARGTALRHGDE